MTIKELEATLGMTRANIRFYEREGLLAPTRLENGYRDYSEVDLAALQKIKLLRQLQFSVEDIRALQTGEKDLTSALREREGAFSREAADLEAARTLCRRMEEEGARYTDMDARKYLDEMDRLAREGTRFPTLQSDALPTVNRPWVRFFARSLDLALCTLAIHAVLSLTFRILPPDHVLLRLLFSYLSWGLLLPLEALLLSTWGATPGKWIFGLKVRGAGGKKLSSSEAWNRTVGVFSGGEGYNIPIYSLVRNWKSYKACMDGEALSWEEGCSYTMKEGRTAGGAAAYVCLTALIFALSLLLSFHVLMPPNRGDLTLPAFVENYNDVVRHYGFAGGRPLGEDGKWAENPGHYYVDTYPDYRYTVEDGRVVGVRYELDEEDLFGASSCDAAILLSLLAARPGVSVLNWSGEGQTPLKQMQTNEDYVFQYRGLSIENQIDYSGYEVVGDSWLIPVEGETQTYHRTFSVVCP